MKRIAIHGYSRRQTLSLLVALSIAICQALSLHGHIEIDNSNAPEKSRLTHDNHIKIGLFSHPDVAHDHDNELGLIDINPVASKEGGFSLDLVGYTAESLVTSPQLDRKVVSHNWFVYEFIPQLLTESQRPPLRAPPHIS